MYGGKNGGRKELRKEGRKEGRIPCDVVCNCESEKNSESVRRRNASTDRGGVRALAWVNKNR